MKPDRRPHQFSFERDRRSHQLNVQHGHSDEKVAKSMVSPASAPIVFWEAFKMNVFEASFSRLSKAFQNKDGNHEPQCSHVLLRRTGHNQITVRHTQHTITPPQKHPRAQEYHRTTTKTQPRHHTNLECHHMSPTNFSTSA